MFVDYGSVLIFKKCKIYRSGGQFHETFGMRMPLNCVRIKGLAISLEMKAYEVSVQYPLSRDEHAAMARYISGIRKQLQDVADLFAARYGRNSSIAEIAVKTLVSSTLLEHELLLLESEADEGVTKLEGLASAAY
jgi:hypothetical protein